MDDYLLRKLKNIGIVDRGPTKLKNVGHSYFYVDIKEAYGNADLLISPVKIGGGTNFKVLEAMASGVPVIALAGRMEAMSKRRKCILF